MFTEKEKYDAICRELEYRKRCYPRWVTSGRMRQDVADYNLTIFTVIAEDYAERCNEIS